ncbi:hypothetical protein WICMUC_005909 [Wickerhamomyces mucosus]|uniref:Signal recognition particle subunit SRP72 n=1 Tax=Wickerhamomyces mucosus TaxID=1378264 RepID=A0A9P8T2Z6_9ASCO|nr:hypothetical protein WICMUC_005909 [Wickerhamomyces mucosus]
MSSLNELLKKLEVYSNDDQHEEVFESSFEILKSSPHDPRALRLTVVALINLDRYSKALEILKQYSQAAQDDLLLEKAYVYYKLNLNKELSQIFDQLTEEPLFQNKGLLHLKAQSVYRLGDYDHSLNLYQQLINSSNDESEVIDLSVNERAVLSDAYQTGVFNKLNPKSPITPSSENSYDLIFNESLIQLGLKNYSKSLELLEIAELRSRESNPSEEDQLTETIPIIIQKAYLYNLIGETQKSNELIEQLKYYKLSDELNQLILDNNIISKINNDKDLDFHLILKELNFPNSINNLSARLSKIQHSVLTKNYAILSSHVGKNIKIDNSNINDITTKALDQLVKANVLLDQDNVKTQAKKSFKYAFKTKELPITLAAAQLNVNINKLDSAIAILENLETKDRILPGIATLLLSLYEEVQSERKKSILFDEVYEAFKTKLVFSVDEYEFIKIFALKFSSTENDKSLQLLTKLNQFKQDDLITSVLNNDLSNLKSIDELTSNLDIEQLISEGIDELSKEQTGNPTTFKISKKRIHKTKKLPKSFDESKLPDPERWLPLKDRSYYKPKKSKKKSQKDTQGGSADNTTEESLVSKARNIAPSQSSNPKKNKKKGRK